MVFILLCEKIALFLTLPFLIKSSQACFEKVKTKNSFGCVIILCFNKYKIFSIIHLVFPPPGTPYNFVYSNSLSVTNYICLSSIYKILYF